MRAGMKTETVCERWEARKDLFNKLKWSGGWSQPRCYKEKMRSEAHTYKDENQNLQIPKTENQKLKKKKDKKPNKRREKL